MKGRRQRQRRRPGGFDATTVQHSIDLLVDHHGVAELEAAGLVTRLLSVMPAESVIRDDRDRLVSLERHAGLIASNILERRARTAHGAVLAAQRSARLDALVESLDLPSRHPHPAVDDVLTKTARARAAAANGTSPQRRTQGSCSDNGASAGETR